MTRSCSSNCVFNCTSFILIVSKIFFNLVFSVFKAASVVALCVISTELVLLFGLVLFVLDKSHEGLRLANSIVRLDKSLLIFNRDPDSTGASLKVIKKVRISGKHEKKRRLEIERKEKNEKKNRNTYRHLESKNCKSVLQIS